jgi:CHAD domain-containing protein
MEIEAKFAVPDLDTFRRLQEADQFGAFSALAGQLLEVHDTYLDTASGDILAAGYVFRGRRQGDQVLYTLKQVAVPADLLHRREELQIALAAELPPRQWPAGTLRDRVLELTGGADLVPLIELDQKRLVRPIQRDQQQIAALSLDEVRVLAQTKERTWLELEVELDPSAAEQDLLAIAEELHSRWSLEAEPRSKFEQALAVLRESPPKKILLTPEERALLQRASDIAGRHVRRARALLALDEGVTQKEAGRRAALSERRVRHWLAAFRRRGLEILPRSVRSSLSASPAGSELTRPRRRRKAPLGKSTEAPPGEPLSAGPVPAALADSPGLLPDDSMAEAARKTLLFHFERMLFHEPGTRSGQDAEELHDMRVATRRMRAALRVFEPYLEPEKVAPFAKGLRRLGRVLGAVRDLDVFRGKAVLYLATLAEGLQGDLDPLLSVLDAQRETARQEMLSYLDSVRYKRFTSRFGQFLQMPDAGARPSINNEGAPVPHRLRPAVPVVIQQRLAAVRAYEEWVAEPDTPLQRFHFLRIASKELRYALEFFQEVLGPEAKAAVNTTKKLQDHLGNLQDAVVACNLLRDFLTWGTWGQSGAEVRPLEPILAPGVAAYMAAKQLEIRSLVGDFPQVWAEVQSPAFRQKVTAALTALG